MRILYIFHTRWLKGGASKSGLMLLKGLKAQGHEIVALCPGMDSLSYALAKESIAVNVLDYRWTYPHFKRNFLGVIKFIPQLLLDMIVNRKAAYVLERYCKFFKPDIIHTNSSVTNLGEIVAKRLGIPHVTHFREFGWKDCSAVMWHERRMNKYEYQYGIAIGKRIMDFHSAKGARIRLIYNGIVKTGSSAIDNNKDDGFLYVGGLYKEKGVEDMLCAYAGLDKGLRSKNKLTIAGSAEILSYLEYLKRLAKDLDIGDDVVWLGERSDAAYLMSKAKAVIVPSYHEAFGRIVVEAMNNGCLVIGRDNDGIKEQFDNGLLLTSEEIGLRFNTVDELTELLIQVATNGIKKYLSMIKRSQTVVESLYTVDRYIENTELLYKEIINRK